MNLRELLAVANATLGPRVLRPPPPPVPRAFRTATRERAILVALAAAYGVPELEDTLELQKAVREAMAREGDG